MNKDLKVPFKISMPCCMRSSLCTYTPVDVPVDGACPYRVQDYIPAYFEKVAAFLRRSLVIFVLANLQFKCIITR
jgi:hypothetical protein